MAFQRKCRVCRDNELLVERTTNGDVKCYAAGGVNLKASAVSDTVGQSQRNAHVVYLLRLFQCSLVILAFKLGGQPCIGATGAESPVGVQLLVERNSERTRAVMASHLSLSRKAIAVHGLIERYLIHLCPLHGIHQGFVSIHVVEVVVPCVQLRHGTSIGVVYDREIIQFRHPAVGIGV